jgi:hypothetical protein
LFFALKVYICPLIFVKCILFPGIKPKYELMKKKVFFYFLVIFSLVSVFAIAQDNKGNLSKQSKPKTEISSDSKKPIERNEIPKDLNQGGSVFFIINDKPVTKEEYMNYHRNSVSTPSAN